ncbi:hypothetical protein JXB12_04000 [candidate division KSB1 bacterium]|nr:hypothetical protein [candidate division KSB1 bacterium]
MVLDALRSEVLAILKQKDVTGKELIRTVIVEYKDKIKTLDIGKYDVDNPASMGNFIAREIIPNLGIPVYKEKITMRGTKRTLYSLSPGENRVEVNIE